MWILLWSESGKIAQWLIEKIRYGPEKTVSNHLNEGIKFAHQEYILINRWLQSIQILRELKQSGIQKILTGKTINLVSNDVQELEKVFWALFLLLFSPLEISASCLILWFLMGWRALVRVAFYAIALVYIIGMSHQSGKLRQKTAETTDRRLEAMNEILSGIRAVKMYAWEWKFAEMIKQLRRYDPKTKKYFVFIIFYFSYRSINSSWNYMYCKWKFHCTHWNTGLITKTKTSLVA